MEDFNKTFLVTTPISPNNEAIENAKSLSLELNSIYCERGKNTLKSLTSRYNVQAGVICEKNKIRLVHNGKNFEFHPNMALLRIETLKESKKDRFIEIAKIKPGDRVLDCTCGLASDAIVAAYITGESGLVTALETSPVLYQIVKCGLKNYFHKKGDINSAMRRVNIINSDYNQYLKQQETNSYDIVYFDPMFENTRNRAQGLDIVRNLACYSLPDLNILNEAKRVARKHVIIKDTAPGLYLRKLNIPVISKARKIWYGRLYPLH